MYVGYSTDCAVTDITISPQPHTLTGSAWECTYVHLTPSRLQYVTITITIRVHLSSLNLRNLNYHIISGPCSFIYVSSMNVMSSMSSMKYISEYCDAYFPAFCLLSPDSLTLRLRLRATFRFNVRGGAKGCGYLT